MAVVECTPGPWKVVLRQHHSGSGTFNGARIVSESGVHIATMTNAADKPIDQKACDASTLAAAPEMLEALEVTRDSLISEFGQAVYDVNFPQIDAAIAKAKGEPLP